MNVTGNTSLLDDYYYYYGFEDGYHYFDPTTTPAGFTDDDYKRMHKIFGYVLLGIAIIGVLGNIVTIIVFQRGRRCRNSWCAFYFKALAVADIHVLLSSTLHRSLGVLEYIDLHRPTSVCVFSKFNNDFCIQISTWITVTITIDRAISVRFPLKGRGIATRKWMCTKLAIICLICSVINLALVTKLELKDSTCVYNPKDIRFLIIHSMISRGVLVCLLPAAINIVCNVFILRVLYHRASDATQMGLAERHVTSRRSDANAVMYRVIAIGVVHLLSTVPTTVNLTIDALHDYDVEHMIDDDTLTILAYVGTASFYLSSGINFIFYGSVGSDFRQDLKDLIKTCFACNTTEVAASSLTMPERPTVYSLDLKS